MSINPASKGIFRCGSIRGAGGEVGSRAAISIVPLPPPESKRSSFSRGPDQLQRPRGIVRMRGAPCFGGTWVGGLAYPHPLPPLSSPMMLQRCGLLGVPASTRRIDMQDMSGSVSAPTPFPAVLWGACRAPTPKHVSASPSWSCRASTSWVGVTTLLFMRGRMLLMAVFTMASSAALARLTPRAISVRSTGRVPRTQARDSMFWNPAD